MNKQTIMIVGLGSLGGNVLEILARIPGIGRVVVLSRNENFGKRKMNSAILGASQMGLYPDIQFIRADVNEVNEIAKLLSEFRPNIICNCMTLQSWWVITTLPSNAFNQIDKARFGPWFPMHFVLAKKLMEAVKRSKTDTFVLNYAFPDAVNPVLSKIGLAPESGVGNIDNTASMIQRTASIHFNVPMSNVKPYLLMAHFICYYIGRFGETGGAPYFLKIMINDKDVTGEIDQKTFFKELIQTSIRPAGVAVHPIVASSVVKFITGILYNSGEIAHAPGPKGLAGGYPVRLCERGVEVILPDGMAKGDAIQINEQCQVLDGVEKIEENGDVIITDESARIMKDLLGVDCKILKISEMEKKAIEIGENYKKYAARFH